jgi:G3E family GTPase
MAVVQVLADHVETADAIVLAHADQVGAGELQLMEGLLHELNQTATVVAATAGAAAQVVAHLRPGAGDLRKGTAVPTPEERAGWWQALSEARAAGSNGWTGEMEEVEEEADDDDDDDDDEDDEYGEEDEEDEDEDGEKETEEEMESRVRGHLSALTKAQLKQTLKDIGLATNGPPEALIRYGIHCCRLRHDAPPVHCCLCATTHLLPTQAARCDCFVRFWSCCRP